MRFKKTQIGNLMNSETKSMKKRNEYFIKEVELLKENQVEILKIKNSVKEIKNELVITGIELTK